MPNGNTGHWVRDYATREDAQQAIDDRFADTGLAYAVEEVPDAPEAKPDPTSTTERLVGLIRDRHAKGLSKYGTTLDRGDLSPQQWTQHAMEEALDLAGYLMRLKDGCAPEPGSTAAHHVEILRARVKELEMELANLKTRLATLPSVPVGASEAPVEGGDGDRRRLEALERWLNGQTYRLVQASVRGTLLATDGTYEKDVAEAPTLAALADKLAEREAKP
jgi:hypothetical protein